MKLGITGKGIMVDIRETGCAMDQIDSPYLLKLSGYSSMASNARGFPPIKRLLQIRDIILIDAGSPENACKS